MSRRLFIRAVQTALLCILAGVSCVRNPPPVAPEPPPPPPAAERPGPAPRLEPEPPPALPPIAPPIEADLDIVSRDLEQLNRESPLRPVFFGYDSSRLDSAGRQVLDDNARVLRGNPSWIITIEGHCDERGTAEYNLALGERRALAARQYLIELGLEGDRLRTVSYGKEFPFAAGSDEGAWAKNRRAHLVISDR